MTDPSSTLASTFGAPPPEISHIRWRHSKRSDLVPSLRWPSFERAGGKQLFSWLKNSVISPCLCWVAMYISENSLLSDFRLWIWLCWLEDRLLTKLLKPKNLFLGITSVMGLFTAWPMRSSTNCWKRFLPSSLAFIREMITSGLITSLESREYRAPESSRKGLPKLSNIEMSFRTSSWNSLWDAGFWSWCLSGSWWFCAPELASNSDTIRASSGPATIHRRRALSSARSPTAPPSPLILAFSCSWAWSLAILEPARMLFCTVKWPFRNSW